MKELSLLKELPRHAPSDELRRAVRIAALDKLAAQSPVPWWRVLVQQFGVTFALAAVSLVYLARAAAETPLLR